MALNIGNITITEKTEEKLKQDGIYCFRDLDDKIIKNIPLDYEFLLVNGENGGIFTEAIECMFSNRQPSPLLKDYLTEVVGKSLDLPQKADSTGQDMNYRGIIFKWFSRVIERLPGRIIVVGNRAISEENWKKGGGDIQNWLKKRVAWIDKFESVKIKNLKTGIHDDFTIDVDHEIDSTALRLLLHGVWIKKFFDVLGYEVALTFTKAEIKFNLEIVRENICLFKYRLLKKIGEDISDAFFLIPFCCPDNCLPNSEGWGINLDRFLEDYDIDSIAKSDRIIRKEIKEGDYLDIVKESIFLKVVSQRMENLTEKERELTSELKNVLEELVTKKEQTHLPGIYNAPTDRKNKKKKFNFKEGEGNLMLEYTQHLSELNPDCARMRRQEIDSTSYIFYQESLSGASLHYSFLYNIIFSEADDNKRADLIFKLSENGLLRILIADERISEYVRKSPENNKIYKCAGMTVIDDLDQLIDNIREISAIPEMMPIEIKTKPPGIVPCYDAFIIHQGLLDKTKLDAEILETHIDDWKRKYFPFIFVTSGRGTPANIPRNVRFIPFSVLESNLISSSPSKFILTNTLFKALARRVK